MWNTLTHSHNDTHTLTMTHTHSHTYTDTLTLTHKHSQTWTVFSNSFKKRKEKKTYFNHFGFCSWESQDQDLILWGLFERKKFPVKLFFSATDALAIRFMSLYSEIFLFGVYFLSQHYKLVCLMDSLDLNFEFYLSIYSGSEWLIVSFWLSI